MYTTVKGVGEVFNRDFAVKNFSSTKIRTRDSPTHFLDLLLKRYLQGQSNVLTINWAWPQFF